MLCFLGRHKVLVLVLPGEWCSPWKVVPVNFFPRLVQATGGNPLLLPLLWGCGWNGVCHCLPHPGPLLRQPLGAEPALPVPPAQVLWCCSLAVTGLLRALLAASLHWAAAFCPLELILSAVIAPICWTLLSKGHSWLRSSYQRCGFTTFPQEKAFFPGWLGALLCKPQNAHRFWLSPSFSPYLGQKVMLWGLVNLIVHELPIYMCFCHQGTAVPPWRLAATVPQQRQHHSLGDTSQWQSGPSSTGWHRFHASRQNHTHLSEPDGWMAVQELPLVSLH